MPDVATMATPGMQESVKLRRPLFRTPSLLAERCALSSADIHAGHSSDHQVVISFHGAFRWRIGPRTRLIDANSALLVFAGEDFYADHVPGVGHANIILTPGPDLAAELFRGANATAPLRPVDHGMRLECHALLATARGEPLAASEIAYSLLQRVTGKPTCSTVPNPRIIERAKALLHASPCDNLTLEDVAHEVGVCPTYLTQLFTRSEGRPLYRYQRHLRLARALNELPNCDDLTSLALDLGFANHSHFTTMFKRAFGLTPSDYRARLTRHHKNVKAHPRKH